MYIHPQSAGGDDETWGSIYLKTVVKGVLAARWVLFERVKKANVSLNQLTIFMAVLNYILPIPEHPTYLSTSWILAKHIFVVHASAQPTMATPTRLVAKYGQAKVLFLGALLNMAKAKTLSPVG